MSGCNRRRARAATAVIVTIVCVPFVAQGQDFTTSAGERGSNAPRHEYGFSMTEFCVETPRGQPPAHGFNPDTRELLEDADAVTAVITGVMQFTNNGDVAINDATISDLFVDQTDVGDVPIASGTPVSCEGTYSMNPGKLVELALNCTAELPNNVSVVIGPFKLRGFLGRLGLTIPISSTAGNIQTETVYVGSTVVAERERVCLIQGTLAKL